MSTLALSPVNFYKQLVLQRLVIEFEIRLRAVQRHAGEPARPLLNILTDPSTFELGLYFVRLLALQLRVHVVPSSVLRFWRRLHFR